MIHEPATGADVTAITLSDVADILSSLRATMAALEERCLSAQSPMPYAIEPRSAVAAKRDALHALAHASRLAGQAGDTRKLTPRRAQQLLDDITSVMKHEAVPLLALWAEHADPDTKKALCAILSAWNSYGY